MTVFLINKALVKETATVVIKLAGFAAKTATAVTLTGPDLKKHQAAPANLPATVQAGEISATLPPNSLTVVTGE